MVTSKSNNLHKNFIVFFAGSPETDHLCWMDA